jgi:hypothetical protein
VQVSEAETALFDAIDLIEQRRRNPPRVLCASCRTELTAFDLTKVTKDDHFVYWVFVAPDCAPAGEGE